MSAWTAPLATLALVLLPAVDADAGAPADRLRGFFAAVNEVLVDPTTEERPLARLEAVRRLVRGLSDYRAAAARALGPEWDALTSAEREEFAALFADFVESTYVTVVASRAQLQGGASVRIVDETTDGDAAFVRTTVASRVGDDIQMTYRMRRKDQRWGVSDVIVDGVSIVDNYRAQMRRVMGRSSYAGLVAEMRAKTGTATPVVAAMAEPVVPPVHPASPPRAKPVADQPAFAADGTVESAVRPTPARHAVRPVIVASATPLAGALAERSRAAPMRPAPPMHKAPLDPPETLAPAVAATPALDAVAVVAPAPAVDSAPAITPVPAVATKAPRTTNATLDVAGAAASAGPAHGESSYWVQVGAFRSTEAATRMAARLASRPMAVRASPAPEPLLRVLVGPFPGRAEAVATLRALKALGYQAFVSEEPD